MSKKYAWVRILKHMDGLKPGDVVKAERMGRREDDPLYFFEGIPNTTFPAFARFPVGSNSGEQRFHEINEMEYLALVASGEIEVGNDA